MPRTRDGFVPLGDVSQAVALRALSAAVDSSTCFLISTLLLRELSRNQVSKKTLGRRSGGVRFTGGTEPIDHAPVRAVRQLGPDTHAPRGCSRQPAHRRGEPFTGRPHPPRHQVARAGCAVHGLRRPPGARRQRGRGVSMAARSFVACAATWRAVSPTSAARCARNDSLSSFPPFPPHFRHPSATSPARHSDAKQQSRPAPDTGHGPWYSRPTRRQPGRPCRAASRSGQCVTPHPSRQRSVGRSDAFSG